MVINFVFNKIIVLMENSVFFRVVTAVFNFFARLFSSSIIIRGIITETDFIALEDSLLYKLARWPFMFLTKLGQASFFKIFDGSIVRHLILASPYLGCIAIVGLAPFIPTMLTAAIIICTFICFVLKCVLTKELKFNFDLMGFWILIFILITLFKGFTSFTVASSLKIAMLTTLFMMFYFLFTLSINSKRELSLVLFVFCTSALFTGIYGLYQQFSGTVDMTWVDQSLFEDVRMRVFSTFDNPNVYGEYLLLALPICFISGIIFKNVIFKLYYFGIGLILIINLALTYSRGCYLAIAFCILIFILLMEKRLVILFSGGIFLLPFVLPPTIINRVLSITNLTDSSTSYRIMIWQASIRILRDFWPSGVGQGLDAYNSVYPMYSFNAVEAPHSHNLFLQIFIETGIVGIIVFMAIIFCFYKTLVPFFCKASTIQKVILAGLMSMMGGFMMQSFFDYSFYNYKVFLIFFMTLAMASVYVRLEANGD